MIRTKVLWHGSREGRDDDGAFRRRDLQLEIIDHEPTEDQLRAAPAIVYCFGEGIFPACQKFLKATIEKAIDYGLFVVIVTETAGGQAYVAEQLADKGVLPGMVWHRIGKSDTQADWQIAQAILAHDPKFGPSAELEIELAEGADGLPLADEILLRRAFAEDCKKIRLVPLSGGFTAEAYMIEATFGGSRAGPTPLPFFAKLGRRDKIQHEQEMYARYATQYIPFHLRPNLHPHGCLLGFERALLVGDFVERAEPLWDAVRKGTAHSAIHSLFDMTLGSWRAQGFEAQHGPVIAPVAEGLGTTIFNYKEVKKEHLDVAKDMGLTLSESDMLERLLGMTSQRYYAGPIHGDLHPDNVFVRQSDAILIDLASVQRGPLSGDLACLETSLAFYRREGDDRMPFDSWRAVAERMFATEAFSSLPLPEKGSGEWPSRWNAARQVRMVALPTQACPEEYMAAVAVYLLRRATYATTDEMNRKRIAFGLVTAERLVRHMTREK